MSRKGDCWYGAPTESPWGRLKVGRLYDRRFATSRDVMDQVIDWLAFHGVDRRWLQGDLGDTLHSISCATGYNLRWLLRAIARLGTEAVFLRLLQAALLQQRAI